MSGIKKYILITALFLTFIAVQVVAAQTPPSCDGTPAADTIICAVSPTSPDDQIDGDLGGDHITQNVGVTTSYIDADGAATGGDVAGVGDGGNDTIVNNGTVTIAISGDYVTGIPGSDTITNNGTTGTILGDETYSTSAPNGNDVIINNGTINHSILGDAGVGTSLAGGAGGDDIITNNGTIGEDIIGDSGSGVGGDDRIVNNGTVTGSILADSGNDTVVIAPGAAVGGTIDGGPGTDTLQFNFVNQTDKTAAAAVMVGKSPAGGTVTFYGQTYTWQNFESFDLQVTTSTANVPAMNYFTTSTPTLTWTGVTWARRYEIQVNNINSFAAPLKFTTSVSSDNLSVQTSALATGTYYWHVRACPAAGLCGQWSVTDTFTIGS